MLKYQSSPGREQSCLYLFSCTLRELRRRLWTTQHLLHPGQSPIRSSTTPSPVSPYQPPAPPSSPMDEEAGDDQSTWEATEDIPVTPSSKVYHNNVENLEDDKCRAPRKKEGQHLMVAPTEQRDVPFTPVGRPQKPLELELLTDPAVRRVLTYEEL